MKNSMPISKEDAKEMTDIVGGYLIENPCDELGDYIGYILGLKVSECMSEEDLLAELAIIQEALLGLFDVIADESGDFKD